MISMIIEISTGVQVSIIFSNDGEALCASLLGEKNND